MPSRPSTALTLADLVVLSMLAERPMHGYEIWAELERREVARWASISKPQIYYSLKKLKQARHIEASEPGDDPALGPDRQTFRPTPSGRRALADALARAEWATQDVPSPFVTWMVLSWQARPRDFARGIAAGDAAGLQRALSAGDRPQDLAARAGPRTRARRGG